MLSELRIRDYAVVEDLTLRLGRGLNVLTGETGAGKSIVVGALSLLLGERASSSVVRVGADRATVEAVFEVEGLEGILRRLDELGFRAEDGLLVLRREVAAEGRNRAWVGGSPATAGVVGELGAMLVDIHGQHEHQTLLRRREQRLVLDAFAGADELAERLAASYRRAQAIRQDIEAREARKREVESRADFLRFQLEEIDGAALSLDEDEALEAEAARFEHAEDLVRGTGEAHDLLYAADDSVTERVAAVRKTLEELGRFDPSIAPHAAVLDGLYHQLVDVGRAMADYGSAVEHDPARHEEVRRRLDRIFRLKRKYGPDLPAVLATGERIRAELQELDDADHELGGLGRELESVWQSTEEFAAELGTARARAAHQLAARVQDALPALGLEAAIFEVRLTPRDEVAEDGAESVDFLVSPNPGFDPMPLARIASGGELSRVMLVLKAILADVDEVPVLVFDEIDAGIGGVVGTAVAAKLAEVSASHQVFVVTHLAQVASRARTHVLVEKGVAGRGVTTASVRALGGDDRVREIARMLGGDPDSTASREHARELLGG